MHQASRWVSQLLFPLYSPSPKTEGNLTDGDLTPPACSKSPSLGLPYTRISSFLLSRVRSEWGLLRVPRLPLFHCPRLPFELPALWTALSSPTNCMWSWAFELLHSFDLPLLLTSDFLIHPLFNPAPHLMLDFPLALGVWASRSAAAHGSAWQLQQCSV